jgi:hypothetical protein
LETFQPDAPPTVAKLSVRRPGQPREEFELSKSPILAGRIKTNDIVIVGDTAVSREHCCFEIDATSRELSVRDLGSSNGTFVNGKTVGQTPLCLKPGDQIQVGATLMIYSVDRPSAGALVRRLKPHGQNLPWPPQEGEKERTVFGESYCICGRCGERIHIRKPQPGEKVGCIRCRAIWRVPVVPADGGWKEDLEATQEILLRGHETTTEREPITVDDAKRATYIIRKPTSSASKAPSLETDDTGEETTERKAPDTP